MRRTMQMDAPLQGCPCNLIHLALAHFVSLRAAANALRQLDPCLNVKVIVKARHGGRTSCVGR
jgi:hypothetical protein